MQHLSVILRGRCTTWSTSVSFCVAGVALGFCWIFGLRFLLHLCLRRRHHHCTSADIIDTPATTSSTQHHLHKTIYLTPSTIHLQCSIINTTSYGIVYIATSTQNHEHDLINTTPFTQHHLHNTTSPNIVCTTLSDTGTWALGDLGTLVMDGSLVCFAAVLHSWLSEDIVSMWGHPVFSYFLTYV